MATTKTRSPQGARAELIADAIAYHEDNDCCTASQPCKDRAKLATLLEQDGGSLRTVGEDVKPGFGKGGGNGRRVVTMATDKQLGFIRTLLLQVPADVAAAYQADADNADLSAQRASTVIEVLLGKKVAGAPNLASEAQVSFLAKLVASRDYFSLLPRDRTLVDKFLADGTVTRSEASRLITELKATAYKTTSAAPSATESAVEAGLYRNGQGVIIKAYKARQSDRILAKRLDVAETDPWTYLGIASRFVTADFSRMTLDEAKAFGQVAVGGKFYCCQCGTELTDPSSQEKGIGPWCEKNGGWA